ncbi:uncharacterized protein [Aristolochia californica]|uniref:uncharacterized protein n=1 Tax=Aristolochia californica TaxID=171875 RepID=UPI0035D9EA68
MGFNFAVEHKPGPLNRATDALTRRSDAALQLAAISHPTPLLLEAIRQEHQTTVELQQLSQKIIAGQMMSHWFMLDHIILYKRRIYILPASPLVLQILSAYHDSAHEGLQKMGQWICSDFYWAGLRSHVVEYVVACLIYQCYKADHLSPAGVL